MGPRASQDLRSPSPIMAPAKTYFLKLLIALGDNYNLRKKKKKKLKMHLFVGLSFYYSLKSIVN